MTLVKTLNQLLVAKPQELLNEVGQKCGLGAASIANTINGKRVPSEAELKVFAEVYGISGADLKKKQKAGGQWKVKIIFEKM